jgi:XTP/dITP diphosphohydrolase
VLAARQRRRLSGICRIAGCFDDRSAAARCIALATDGAGEAVGMGVVTGTIVESPRGRHGFGWDSVFAPGGGDGRTYAEMAEAQKDAIPTAVAFEALRAALEGRGSAHASAQGDERAR